MSNDKNVWLGFSSMFWNQSITDLEFFHWLTFIADRMLLLLILSRMTLLTFPSSHFDGLIRRHFTLEGKFFMIFYCNEGVTFSHNINTVSDGEIVSNVPELLVNIICYVAIINFISFCYVLCQ
jgi:hypothetical protein